MTTRNRLISTARTSTRSGRLEIIDERSGEVYRILVAEGKAMSFLPGRRTDDELEDRQIHLFQPSEEEDIEEPDDGDLTEHHVDLHLQTALTDEALQRRLLKLFYDARTCQRSRTSPPAPTLQKSRERLR
ncbi:MAG: DUF4011 domain-containing protein [Planctomycetaceae bacterium]